MYVYMLFHVLLLSFYTVALVTDSGASEVHSLKSMWYLSIIVTGTQFISVLNIFGAIAVLDDDVVSHVTIYCWHKSKPLTALLILNQVVKSFCLAAIFYLFVTISSWVGQMKEYTLFKYSIELQASLFIICFGVTILVAIVICVSMIAVVVHRNWNEVVHIVNIESSRVEMVTNEEPERQRPLVVTKTDDSTKQCLICSVNEKTHACIPCGHLSLCAECADRLSKEDINGQMTRQCPKCSFRADTFSRIYL